MALKFSTEEEAREWLKKVKSAGAAPAKSETITLDQALGVPPAKPAEPAAPTPPPAPPQQERELPSFVQGEDEPPNRQAAVIANIVSLQEVLPGLASIIVSGTALYFFGAAAWNSGEFAIFGVATFIVALFAYIITGMLILGVAAIVAMFYDTYAPAPFVKKKVRTPEEERKRGWITLGAWLAAAWMIGKK